MLEEPKTEDEKESDEKPQKKKCWWGKQCKTEEEQKDDHISIGIDLVNRDEKVGAVAWMDLLQMHESSSVILVYQ